MAHKSFREVPVFKTIRLGTGLKTAEDFYRELRMRKLSIDPDLKAAIGKGDYPVEDQEIEVDLVVVSVEDLGFPKGAWRERIFHRAVCGGLQLCSYEVPLQMLLQCGKEIAGDRLIMSCNPVVLGFFRGCGARRECRQICIGNKRGSLSQVEVSSGCRTYVWPGSAKFVFIKPRDS